MSIGRAHMKISSGGNYKNDYILNRNNCDIVSYATR